MVKVNSPGVQQTQTRAASLQSPNGPAPAGAGELHVVAAGETLSHIAKAKLGDGNRWREIAELNPQIKNPDRIFAGDQVRLPAPGRRKIDIESVLQRVAVADDKQVVQNFAKEHDGTARDLPKKNGTLNLLNQVKALETRRPQQEIQGTDQPSTTDAARTPANRRTVEDAVATAERIVDAGLSGRLTPQEAAEQLTSLMATEPRLPADPTSDAKAAEITGRETELLDRVRAKLSSGETVTGSEVKALLDNAAGYPSGYSYRGDDLADLLGLLLHRHGRQFDGEAKTLIRNAGD